MIHSRLSASFKTSNEMALEMVLQMVFVPNPCTVKIYMHMITTNIEWTGTASSESGPIRPLVPPLPYFISNDYMF